LSSFAPQPVYQRRYVRPCTPAIDDPDYSKEADPSDCTKDTAYYPSPGTSHEAEQTKT